MRWSAVLLAFLVSGCASNSEAPEDARSPTEPSVGTVPDVRWRNDTYVLTTAAVAGAAGIRVAPGGGEAADLIPNCIVAGDSGARMTGTSARMTWDEPVDLELAVWARNVGGTASAGTMNATRGQGSLEVELWLQEPLELVALLAFPVGPVELGLPIEVSLEADLRGEGYTPAVMTQRCS